MIGLFAFFTAMFGGRAVPIAAVILLGGMANMVPDWIGWFTFIFMWLLFPATLSWNIFGAVIGFSGVGTLIAGLALMFLIAWDIYRLVRFVILLNK